MQQYRKKPVVIEAFRLGFDPIPEWASNENGVEYHTDQSDQSAHYALIPTLEGSMRANLGDWIIRGVKSELYPCKPDIFEATYDAV